MCDLFGTQSAAEKAQRQSKKAAQKAEAAEAKRQSDITLGNQNIDTAFGQYDQPFFDQYRETYTGNYNPQIDRQYGSALAKLMASLEDRGMGQSTVATQKVGDVARTRDEARSRIASEADAAAGTLRGNVERQKTSLYALNQAAADPEGIKARAIGEATSLAVPQATSPLGDLFASALAPYTYYQQARQNSPGPGYRYTGPGAGSSSIVRA